MKKFKKIKLNLYDKLEFFKVPIILISISIFCFYYGISNISDYSINELNNKSNIFGISLFLLGLTLFIKQNNNLKFIKVHNTIDISLFKKGLNDLTEEYKWELEKISENHVIIKTDSAGSYSRYFLAKSYGEIIHIIIAENKILFKSIFDVDKNSSITISTGENKSNEKIIKKLITSFDKKHI